MLLLSFSIGGMGGRKESGPSSLSSDMVGACELSDCMLTDGKPLESTCA